MSGRKQKIDGEASSPRYAVRMTPDLIERIKVARDREAKKVMVPISQAAIVRRCLELGLAQLERSGK